MIYIPFDEHSGSIGGPSTFMANFREYLLKVKYPFIENKSDYRKTSGIFFPISFDERILIFFKENNLPVIQRLDGVYYPSKHGIKYIYLNWEIKKDYLKFSDFIIFQSKYSRKECFTMLGEIEENKYRIIYNGTDKSIFYPADKKFDKSKIVFTTTGSFRNRDMIEPVVMALDTVAENYDIELRIIGPIISRDVKKYINRPYIKYFGGMDKRQISMHLHQTDILIHCQLNPACPNSVIEALSCGVPVVGFDTGAMKEILYFSPELLAYVSEDTFQRYVDFRYEKLLDKIMLCIDNYDVFKKKFMDNSYLYDNKDTFERYLKVFSLMENRNDRMV